MSINVFGFQIGRVGSVNNLNDNSRKQSTVLDIIKYSVSLGAEHCDNVYTKYRRDKKMSLTQDMLKTICVENAINGISPIYGLELRTNIIKSMTKSLSREVVDEINLIGVDSKGNTKTVTDIKSEKEFNISLNVNENIVKDIFEKAFLWEKCLIVGIIRDGVVHLSVIQPYKYTKVGDSYLILTSNGKDVINETRDDTFSPLGKLCWEFSFNDSFYDKLESIFAYEIADSAITKETRMNLSKLFIDRELFKENPVEQEVLNIVDVPSPIQAGAEGSSKASYYDVYQGKNSLSELVEAKKDKQDSLTNLFKLSARALGLKTTSTDFASELPYENDLTAKTVNDYRSILSQLLTGIARELTKVDYIIHLGEYELNSYIAIVSLNKTAIESGQMSLETAVKRLNPYFTEENVSEEVIKIKIDNPKYTLNNKEIELGKSLGLLSGSYTNETIDSSTEV